MQSSGPHGESSDGRPEQSNAGPVPLAIRGDITAPRFDRAREMRRRRDGTPYHVEVPA
jgi:hypothetical protein